jgi:GMP synthase (glutamine-hydrolysing)
VPAVGLLIFQKSIFNEPDLTAHVHASHSKILILDFGSQVTQLIARRVREAGVFCEVFPHDVTDEFVRNYGAAGVILRRPNSVTKATPARPQAVFELGVPVLGICYGMQTMAEQLGGKVENGHLREFGYAEVRAHGHTAAGGISDFTRRPRHAEGLDEPRRQGHRAARRLQAHGLHRSCPIAGMADEERVSTACSSTRK